MNEIINGDCLTGLRKMGDQSVNCCVTSPPYWGLRDYGHKDQLGPEKTPEEYVEKIVEIFREVKRVLKNDGTLWLNLGDSYAHPNTGGNGATGGRDKSTLSSEMPPIKTTPVKKYMPKNLKPKDLVGIPWMTAFALRDDGWYLRQDIIWHKKNPMPESVTDRCTKAHEYIFLMSKSKNYYYDNEAIKTPLKNASIARLIQNIEDQKGSEKVPGKTNDPVKAVFPKRNPSPSDNRKGNQGCGGIPISLNGSNMINHHNFLNDKGELIHGVKANKKSVWTVSTEPLKEAHFAAFPQELIVDCIKAGCPEGGVVLDPFMGSGRTALVARKLNRNYMGFELNESYIKISNKLLYKGLGMFN